MTKTILDGAMILLFCWTAIGYWTGRTATDGWLPAAQHSNKEQRETGLFSSVKDTKAGLKQYQNYIKLHTFAIDFLECWPTPFTLQHYFIYE